MSDNMPENSFEIGVVVARRKLKGPWASHAWLPCAVLPAAPAALALLATFILLRTALLGTLENPEPRYTLECFPIVLALAGIGTSRAPKFDSEG